MENVSERINRYVQDTIAAERNFENALRSFAKSDHREEVKIVLTRASSHARAHRDRLTELLKQRGGSPSAAKSLLAIVLASMPLAAQSGYPPEEKNTQHLVVTYGALNAAEAMYEALAQTADEIDDANLSALARQMLQQKSGDARQVWPLLRPSARDAFRVRLGEGAGIGDVLRSYLEDLIAAEKGFESQLVRFSRVGDYAPARVLFIEHAHTTKDQQQRLTEQLRALGGATSTAKGLLANLLAVAPKAAQIGHDGGEREVQNLIMAYAAESAETAMYEVFAAVASDAGHRTLEELGVAIQRQERTTAAQVWSMVELCARRSIQHLTLSKAS